MKVFRRYFDFEPSPLDRTLSAQIHTLGHHVHPAHMVYPDTIHPDSHFFDWEKGRSLTEYQILYICKGEGTFEAYGMPPQLIRSGTVILLYPGVWHRYQPSPTTGWEEYWVGFSGSYAQYLLEQECFNPQNPIIKVGFNGEFLATFGRLFDVVEIRQDSYQKLASFLLVQLLGIVYTSVLLANQQVPRRDKIIGEIKKEINEKWHQNIDYKRLADRYNVSYAWLRKVFKDVAGTSMSQYQLQLKLQKADELIPDISLTLSEIALRCGFDTVHYFSRIYKLKMGVNPGSVRKLRSIERR